MISIQIICYTVWAERRIWYVLKLVVQLATNRFYVELIR